MLSKTRLPREELLVTFVRSRGLDEDEVMQWAAVRARIAYGFPATSIADHTTSARRPAGWRQALAGAAVVLAFVGGAVFTGGTVNDSIDEETVVATP
jgi:hypothetical protein